MKFFLCCRKKKSRGIFTVVFIAIGIALKYSNKRNTLTELLLEHFVGRDL